MALCVLAAMGLSACGKKDAEVSVPHVEVVEPAWLREEIIESLGKNKYTK